MDTTVKLEEMEKVDLPKKKETSPRAKVSKKKVLAIVLAAAGVLGALGYWL
jgi:hypothetical protein